MSTHISFVLLTFFALSIVRAYCFPNFSFSRSNLSSTTINNSTDIQWTDAKNKASFDHLPVQLNSNMGKHKKNRAESWKDQFNVQITGPGILKLNQLLPGLITRSNSSYTLNLNNHGLNSLSSGAFEELVGLKALLLNKNNFGLLNATIFKGLKFLETLQLDMNNLTTLPVDVFLELINLKTITLNANNFSSLPADLFVHNKKLNTIELINNALNITDLPRNLFSGFVGLEIVLLQNIGLHRLSEELFWNSHELKEIDLSRNYLKMIPKNLLKDARELRSLNLSSNYLSILPNGLFTVTNKLDQLDLSGNYIKALNNWNLFLGLHSLRVLNMTRNDIEIIHPDAFISLSNLKIAKFAHNHLNLTTGLYNIFGHVSLFRHCPLLEELDLSHNKISEIYNDWILEHTLLRRLDLSYNNLSYLQSKNLRFKSNNLHVDLSHNMIKIVNLTELDRIPKNANSSRNVTVNLNYNPIECYCYIYSLERYIRRETSEVIKQEDLDYVKFLTDNLSCNAPNYYRGKLLKDIMSDPRTEFSCTVKNGRSASCASGGRCDCYIKPRNRVQVLDCGGRNLTEAPAWIISWNILWGNINLRDNALRETPDLTLDFYKTIGAIDLDLSGNQIERLENNRSFPTYLYKLNLNHNKITDIDMDFVQFMSYRLGKLEIRKNPWHCTIRTYNFGELARRSFENKDFYCLWDMKDFTCDINATLQAQPCRLQPSSHSTNKYIIVYTLLAVLVLMILCTTLFVVDCYQQRRAQNFQQVKHPENSAKL